MARGACCKRIDDQAVAVLHQRLAHEAKLRLLARPLAVELRVGIGGGVMSVVAALLAAEVLFAIAPSVGRRPGAVLRPEALGAGPGLQERAVDREWLGREQRPDLRLRQHTGQEP